MGFADGRSARQKMRPADPDQAKGDYLGAEAKEGGDAVTFETRDGNCACRFWSTRRGGVRVLTSIRHLHASSPRARLPEPTHVLGECFFALRPITSVYRVDDDAPACDTRNLKLRLDHLAPHGFTTAE